jgi:hypothetical protein
MTLFEILHGFILGFSLQCFGFTPQMALAVGTTCFHKFSIEFYALVFIDLVHWLGS